MPITIAGSGTITGISAGGLPDAIITRAEMGYAGAILQVVQTVKTDTFSTTSTSFTDVTDLTAAITPSSSSSKILILLDATLAITPSISSTAIQYRISGGNSTTYVGDAAGSRIRAIGGIRTAGTNADEFNFGNGSLRVSGIYLDSPSTASAVTYSMQIRVPSQTGFVNRAGSTTDDDTHTRSASSITVMEVAG